MKLQTLAKATAITVSLLLAAGCTQSFSRHAAVAPPTPKVCEGGHVESQASLGRYSGCTALSGSLNIEGADVYDLTPLAALRSVRGKLAIAANPTLENLNGLERLQSADQVVVLNNPMLEEISALGSLSDVNEITVMGNPNLKNLEGLEQVRRLTGLLLGNNGLCTTRGLENLLQVEDLVVYDHRRLISLGGLRNLQQATNVNLERNPLLARRLGLLDSVERIEGELLLNGNSGLAASEVAEFRARHSAPSKPMLSASIAGFRSNE